MGMWELVVVFIVGLVVLGPERLPVAIRTVSRWVKTAKPFLEDWVKQQVGPLSVLKQMYANLPFWAEKMPELPDLIYQNLKRAPHSHAPEIKVSHKPLVLGLFSSAAMIVSALFYLQHNLIAAGVVLSCAVIGFIAAWRRS